MKERPILFSAPMVRALLAGTKTQTRRVVKPMQGRQSEWLSDDLLQSVRGGEMAKGGWQMWHPKDRGTEKSPLGWIQSPYGMPGDRLWVRETWRPERQGGRERIYYAADGEFTHVDAPSSWRRPKAAKTGNVSPLFMPRWASRITLEVTDVRVERLQSISEADALAEGVSTEWTTAAGEHLSCSAREAYSDLWESINGAGSWARNPWVWVVAFRRATP